MPGGKGNINGSDGKQFSTEYQPEYNPGRPKKILTHIKDLGYHESEVKDTFKILLFYTINELLALSKDKDQPVIVLIVAKNLYKAAGSGKVSDIKDILESIIEKPTQKIESTNHSGLPALTATEQLEIDKQIEDEYS